MGGICLLGGFLLLGVLSAWRLFPMLGRQSRAWFGCVLGFMMMMWLPSLFAFALTFNQAAQYWALGAGALGTGGIWMARWLTDRRRARLDDARGALGRLTRRNKEAPIKLTLCLVVPFLLLGGYLAYTHTLQNVDGALCVGQSTFGDLPLHLGIATGLRGASYPPEYTILPGTMLGYPFLFDALSASMLVLGTPLALSFILPSTLGMGLVFWGFVMFAWEITRDARAVVIAYLLVFLNGGLGFLSLLKGWPGGVNTLENCLTGFYQTPTNMPELNLRWVNVIADLMIPQRTLLAGWMAVLPALYLLTRAIKTRRRFYFVVLGVWAGLMPMIHTHSFLALGLISAGAMIAQLVSLKRERARTMANYLVYAGLALALALPQLLTWSFPQTAGSGALRFVFNWVNNQNGQLIDGYLWFWIKNVGPVYLLMIPAALNLPKRLRPLCLGALFVYAAAEFIQFQPNIYDNNKLFYVAFLTMLPAVGALLMMMWRRLSGVRGRGMLAALFMAVCLASGGLTLAREVVSQYVLFSEDEVAAAKFIEENAPMDAVVLTGTQHNNAIAALTGRKLVCGTATYLYFHGIDYDAPLSAATQMYESPKQSANLYAQYGVDYVYLSAYEYSQFEVDDAQLEAQYRVVFENDETTILAVAPPGTPVPG
ncbi:MAG: hypothetical protein RSD95_14300 [Clostridia bacterium]